MFYEIRVLKNMAKLIGKQLCLIVFLMKLQTSRDSDTGVCYWTPPNDCFYFFQKSLKYLEAL